MRLPWRPDRSLRPQRSLNVTISGWLFEYWLAPAEELTRLVPDEPERRTDDFAKIRWDLVADTASAALRIARERVGDARSPALLSSWDMTVAVPTCARLKKEEIRIVTTLFSWEAAVSDFGDPQVTNGRHRMYYSWKAGAAFLPIQSSAVSNWTASLFGDPSCTDLRFQTWDCASLHRFAGLCEARRAESGADQEFIDAISDAVDVSEEFLAAVAADAFLYSPGPRRLTPA